MGEEKVPAHSDSGRSTSPGAGLSDLKHKLVAILDEEIALEAASDDAVSPFSSETESGVLQS